MFTLSIEINVWTGNHILINLLFQTVNYQDTVYSLFQETIDKHEISFFIVNGLGEYKKRRHIFEWLKCNKHEICFLQELHS